MKTLHKARTLLVVMYAYMVEYRAELILWALSGSLPFILMGVWVRAADGGQFGIESVDFARYYLSVFIIRQLSVVWVIWEFEYDVNKGKLSPQLLLPMDPVWRYFATHVSERFARLPFSFFLVVLFFVLYPEAKWRPALDTVLLAAGAALGAFVLRFAIQYTLAMLAFWTERASAAETLWHLAYLFLSGMLAPLELFPPAVRAVAEMTPFPYLVYVPASLLVGRDVDVTRAFVVIGGWLVVFILLNRVAWRAGLRRYSAMGA